MKFIHILVEGQTEELFVRDILNEYFEPKNIFLNPIIIQTRKAIGSDAAYRGGSVTYPKLRREIIGYIRDTGVVAVTTMFDSYGLRPDFPGYGDREARQADCYKAAAHLEQQFAKDIGHTKFIPYLSIHEFEGLLFSEPEKIVTEVRGQDVQIAQDLKDIRDNHKSPEEINTVDPPSKRILKCLAEYNKRVHGFLIAVEIGIDRMLEECPHFREWVAKLESLAD